MRTTLAIHDDILDAARSLARAENRSLGDVISDLARRGLAPRQETASRRGFPVFDVDPDSPPITPEKVRELLDEDSL